MVYAWRSMFRTDESCESTWKGRKGMKDFFQGFVVAFSMYSKIPMPRIEWTEKNMKYCICFFPLIGLVIGTLQNGWYALAGYLGFGVLFRTAVLVLIPVLVSGGIHLDGLLDTADALSSYKSREEKLEILKDSHAGAFAVIVGVSYFVLAFGAYSEVDAGELQVIGLSFVLSRAFSGLGLVCLRKAKNTGLLRTFSDAAANRKVAVVMAGMIALTVAAMLRLSLLRGGIAAAMAMLTFAWYRRMAYRSFGGITGDLAGCFLQVCELAVALGVVCV